MAVSTPLQKPLQNLSVQLDRGQGSFSRSVIFADKILQTTMAAIVQTILITSQRFAQGEFTQNATTAEWIRLITEAMIAQSIQTRRRLALGKAQLRMVLGRSKLWHYTS